MRANTVLPLSIRLLSSDLTVACTVPFFPFQSHSDWTEERTAPPPQSASGIVRLGCLTSA